MLSAQKASSVAPSGVPAYREKETRPLSIVNTDNRSAASTLSLCVEPLFARWVSPMQRGFLRGRSMIENILDIDLAMRLASFLHIRSSLLLFDLRLLSRA